MLNDLLAEHPNEWNFNKKITKNELSEFINSYTNTINANRYDLKNINDSSNVIKAEDTYILNQIDNVKELIYSTIYKLENLS